MLKQLEVKHELFESVEDMLSPKAMSAILKRNVSGVTRQLFEADGASASQFYWVHVDHQRFMMKCMNVASNWLALATFDARCRPVRLWQYGLLDRLQPQLDHAIVAACCDGNNYALLMHDLSSGVINIGQKLTATTMHSLLDALAAMRASFWNNEDLRNPALGLSDVETFVTAFWPIDINRKRYDMAWMDKAWDMLTGHGRTGCTGYA